jgi:hypothetical protein
MRAAAVNRIITKLNHSIHKTNLKLFQRDLLLSKILGDEVAVGLDASRVIFHVKSDGAPSLGASTDVIKLETHQRLNKSCKEEVKA